MFSPNSNYQSTSTNRKRTNNNITDSWFFNSTNSNDSKPETGLNRAPLSIRMGFLRKVYGILSAQLAFTTLMSVAIIMNRERVQMFLGKK
jgi:FtsH-binding integral membrane protein